MRYIDGGLKVNGFLLDTNILLEVLLGQANKDLAKKVVGELMLNYPVHISDFTLHTIGIKLFGSKKISKSIQDRRKDWEDFLQDIGLKIRVLTLPLSELYRVGEIIEKYKLDFDDAYQVTIATTFDLAIVSEDEDIKDLQAHNPAPVRVYTLDEMAHTLSITP